MNRLIRKPQTSAEYGAEYYRLKHYIDRVIEMLVSKGICAIENGYFDEIRTVLPGKLRGQVLFHSDIKTKIIFITYTKAGT